MRPAPSPDRNPAKTWLPTFNKSETHFVIG
jgi:hypothetical protein